MPHDHLHDCPACALDVLTEDTCPRGADHLELSHECPGCREKRDRWESSLPDLDQERLLKQAQRTLSTF